MWGKQEFFFSCKEGVWGTSLIEVEEGMEYVNDFTQEEYDFLGEPGTERVSLLN